MSSPPSGSIDPKRAALLLMDFQPGILGSLSNSADLVTRAAAARDIARGAGMKVVHVRVAFTEQDFAAVPTRNKSFAPIAANRVLIDGTPAADIHPSLAPLQDEVVVRKTRFGAFSATDLDRLLNPSSYDVLVLAGVSTSGVVLSTLRDASDRDYGLVVLADCCADPQPEVHRVLTDTVFARQAEVVASEQFGALLAATS